MPSDPGAGRRTLNWIRTRFGGSAQESPEAGRSQTASAAGASSEPGQLVARVSCRSNVVQVLNPSSQTGPEPVHIAVTGCSVIVELAAHGLGPVVVTGLGAEITSAREVEFDGVGTAESRMPDVISQDLVESFERAVAGFEPLEAPHFEALLDQTPPSARRAHLSDGRPAAPPIDFPLMLRPDSPDSYAMLLVAPVTDDVRLLEWNLLICWAVDGSASNVIRWPLLVTGDTGWTTFTPGGMARSTPIGDIAPDHWSPR